MIIVKLFGGLGNQMFQYAAAKGLQENNELIFVDASFFVENGSNTDTFAARKFELTVFTESQYRFANRFFTSLFTAKSGWQQRFRQLFKRQLQYLHHPGSQFVDLSTKRRSLYLYMDGYFQSERYFKHVRNSLLKEFTFPALDIVNETIHKSISSKLNPVSVHIRRGDYLMPNIAGIHGLIPLAYYHQAIDLLRSQHPDIALLIFLDDIEWVKANLDTKGLDVTYVTGNQDENSWKDMALMSYCKHHIIANSSFSWWGAWLSTVQGETIAPRNWFQPSVEYNIHDIVPADWTLL